MLRRGPPPGDAPAVPRGPARAGWAQATLRALALTILLGTAGCSDLPEAPLEPAMDLAQPEPDYRIAPGDNLSVFVWQDRELSLEVRVRPDGRISMPLIQDVQAAGRTPSELGQELAGRLEAFIQEPVVTVIVADYVGPLDQQVRVIGEAVKPQALPYQPRMTLLDAVIAVGGLTEFADGNRAILVRTVDDEARRYRVRLADLLQRGEMEANVGLLPGDVLIIPETIF